MTAALGLALAVALAAPAEAPLPPPRPALQAAVQAAGAPEAGEPTARGTVALVPPEKPAPAALVPPEKPAPAALAPPEEPAPAAVVRPAPMPAPDEIVCRDPRLTGDPKPQLIETDTHACGIFDPVRVRSVAGMRLKPPIVVECPTARRLAHWLDGIVRPEARERFQARVAVVRTMGSYACRTRNHVAGGRLSEHGRGRAVDIGGFTLADGREISLERHWGEAAAGAFLRSIWRKACGPFATVLGPESDRHHRDHFHLDMAPRGGEPYCR